MQYYAEKITEFTLAEARRAQPNQAFVQELRQVRRGNGTALLRWIADRIHMRKPARSTHLATPPMGRWSW
jgi:hypothetical protein